MNRLTASLLLLALAVLTGCKKQEAFEMMTPPEGTPAANAPLQKLWPAPAFTLTERSGQPVSSETLAGKVWVADFFYTTCPGPCPMLSSRLSDLQEKLAGKDDVRLVSISLDPEKDTPEVLQAYATKFKAGQNWLFFTGEKAKIHDLAMKGFKMSAVEDRAQAEPIVHSTKLVLVDRSGTVRGFYEGVGADDTAKLLADIDRLLQEKPTP